MLEIPEVPDNIFHETGWACGYRWALEDFYNIHDSWSWSWAAEMGECPQREGYAAGMMHVSFLLCLERN